MDAVRVQPQGPGAITLVQQGVATSAVVPEALKCLVGVEEVILKDKDFQTRSGETLFSVLYKEVFDDCCCCCGTSRKIRLTNSYKTEVIGLSSFYCDYYLQVAILSGDTIGYVKINSAFANLIATIYLTPDIPLYTASLPLSNTTMWDSPIEVGHLTLTIYRIRDELRHDGDVEKVKALDPMLAFDDVVGHIELDLFGIVEDISYLVLASEEVA
ncbi:uncharacterized protein LOC120930623 [Rana temporaria]|uniref:uncharacterized protein LOC120930623 n=1 Tax=Rana temporaria TaxID=8407 RepID=UPI001AAD1760|nr:uncharacterized protein LOC120930623 [Rana temporaria]